MLQQSWHHHISSYVIVVKQATAGGSTTAGYRHKVDISLLHKHTLVLGLRMFCLPLATGQAVRILLQDSRSSSSQTHQTAAAGFW